MKNKTMHLCNTCEDKHTICAGTLDGVKYGPDIDRNNVIECPGYKRKVGLGEQCCPNCGCETFAQRQLGEVICCRCFEVYHV